ncbi:MAG: cytochrome c [Bacteroidetes bacterium]|nr:cytochrome c [Bacteroidota bacterium]
MRFTFCLLPTTTACCLLAFSSCGNNSSQKNSQAKSSGQTLYENYCTNCHGSDGKLCALGAKDLSMSTLNKEEKIEIITNGKNTMASFKNVMNEKEIGEVVDYIRTLKAK